MDRWDRVGRLGGYGAALALTPYLLIKVSWVIAAALGIAPIGAGFDVTGWVALNTVTVGMSAIGITVALALVRPWGTRIPGRPLAFCAWVGTGFLVPLLPYAVLGSLLLPSDDGSRAGADDDPAMPGWEGVLVQLGFIGMGLGLALALPAYVRRRWPDVFTGRTGDGGQGPLRVPPWPTVTAAVIGAVWLYWAAGGTAGIAHPAQRDLSGRLIMGTLGGWALLAAAATWSLTRGRPARLARRVPLTACWLGSGTLFAWSAWKLPFTLCLALARPADPALPENLAIAAVLHVAAVGTGAAMLRELARAQGLRSGAGGAPRDRGGVTPGARRASAGSSP
ncbi:hypothetical protein ACFWZ2_12400 [Streptomyces sp. NPDC059002]|uniref:hypothetical protein n=1 Tax=Streptomyces sp. NPDC059002 TaxID=3346690 RepID=UPI0036CEB262